MELYLENELTHKKINPVNGRFLKGIQRSNIGKVVRGERNYAGGFIWKEVK